MGIQIRDRLSKTGLVCTLPNLQKWLFKNLNFLKNQGLFIVGVHKLLFLQVLALYNFCT